MLTHKGRGLRIIGLPKGSGCAILGEQRRHGRNGKFSPPMKTELIEKASRIVGDNQLFINIVSKRVQQLTHGADPYVPTEPEMGLGDIALTEIVEGKLVWREAEEGEDLGFGMDFEETEEPAEETATAPTEEL